MTLIHRSAIRLLAVFISLFAASTFSGAEIGPFTGPAADAESARLLERAQAYVRNVNEGTYSYAYIQFHWKRAGNNIDRILNAYPDSPTATALRNGSEKVGPFEPVYFKERVLPRLEEKKVASFDAVSCAIFLYNLENNTDAIGRKQLLASIVQTLCRQMRWTEALAFPVLDEERAWLWNEVVRQTTIYRNDPLTQELFGNVQGEHRAFLGATVLEGMAFRGDTITELESFIAYEELDTPEMRAAVLRGLLRRDLPVQIARQQNREMKGIYSGVDSVQKAEEPSPDIVGFLATIRDGKAKEDALQDYAVYLAGVGRIEEARRLASRATLPALAVSHAGYLIAHGRIQEALDLAKTLSLSSEASKAYSLELVRLFAEDGRDRELERHLKTLPASLEVEADIKSMLGSMHSTQQPLMVREHSFAKLKTDDPNLTGRLICEWSLTPTRNLRGAAPWDAVVYKFAPGFENLPPPKDLAKVEAAGR